MVIRHVSYLAWILMFFISGSIEIHGQDQNFHIYLCFGQSNMEGQGEIDASDLLANERFQVMQAVDCPDRNRLTGKWYPAIPPLCQCGTGLSPAANFGKTMIEHLSDTVRIGVINVAVGGCDIRLFDKDLYRSYDSTFKEDWFRHKVEGYGGNPYQYLIGLAKKAQEEGLIKGILLHQGETNTGDEQWPNYVNTIYENMLRDLSLRKDEVPLLVGELVHEEQEGLCSSMNPVIRRLPQIIPNAHVISSKGCSVMPDKVHFDAEGSREMGRRYALKMLSLMGYE